MKQYGLGGHLTPEMYQVANEIYPSNVVKDACQGQYVPGDSYAAA